METDPILKLLGLPRELSIDPKIQMEYDQVNNNFRALADIRFKLLALVPPLSGVATFALSRTLANDLKASQYAIGLVVSILGFLATLGLTIYDQRNSQIYNALGGRANHLEYRAAFEPNPLLKPAKVGGQFLERPSVHRKLLGVLPLKHDIALALIYGSALGAWFFPIVYAALSLIAPRFPSFNARVPAGIRSAFALATAMVMVGLLVFDLIRLDNTFSDSRIGTLKPDLLNPNLLRIEYSVRGDDKILWGETGRMKVQNKAGEKIEMPTVSSERLVEVQYQKNWLRKRKREVIDAGPPRKVREKEVNRLYRIKFLTDG